jgi:biotin carboxylase
MSNFPEMDYKPIATEELVELASHETSLDFLRKVYRSVKQPMSRRMRAAIEALPHEHPRLGAVAIGSMNGQHFASMLERAIERSAKAKLIELQPNAEAAE